MSQRGSKAAARVPLLVPVQTLNGTFLRRKKNTEQNESVSLVGKRKRDRLVTCVQCSKQCSTGPGIRRYFQVLCVSGYELVKFLWKLKEEKKTETNLKGHEGRTNANDTTSPQSVL